MQRGEHEVTGQGCLHRDLRRFQIADFPDHDDVRILPQNGSQRPREGHADALVHLRLADPAQVVFDRIFHRHDVGGGGFEPRHRGIKRGRLARAGRAGHEHDAVRPADQLVEMDQRVARHAQRFEVQPLRVLFQQTQHRAFAMTGRQRGHPHVDRPAADAQRNTAILRQPFFRNVQLRHDLDPRDQRAMQRLLRPHDIAQGAIDTKAHHRRSLERFDMNIRSLFARCLRQQRVDHADDRRVVFRFEQILDLGNVLHQPRQIDFAFHFAHDLRRAAVIA